MKPSKYQTLVINDSTLEASQHKIENKSSSREESSRRKRDKYAYCKNLGHDEHKCFHNKINELTHIFQKNNIEFPSSVSSPSSQY